MPPSLSIVVPAYNEAEILPAFLATLDKALAGKDHELVFVDDGSTDGSDRILDEAARANPRAHVLHFTRNFGQTAALAAGLERARGDVVVTLDADGQNDPADIPALLAALDAGADVACGWRRNRQDAWLSRLLPSRIANAVIQRVTGLRIHDHGCTLRAYRRAALADLRLYGEMHRLIPVWCAWRGARIAEVEVRHHARAAGRSKYGIGRTFKVLLDLLTAKFFYSYLSSPSHALGGVGLGLMFLGFLAGSMAFLDKFFLQAYGHLRIPFMILSVFLGLLGMQFLALGVLAEILVRIYYENKNERPYRVARVFPEPRDTSSAGRPN